MKHLLTIPFLLWTLGLLASGDWPQFRGPGGQGESGAKNLPISWSESENIRWKTPIPGQGWSSPVIGEGQIWMTISLESGHSLRAICVDQESGKIIRDLEIFSVAHPEIKHAKNSYASPTPVLDGGVVYVHFGTYGTAAIDARTGAILWKNTDFKIEHGVGPGSSPILYRELLILTFDGMDLQFLVALDKATGKTVWKTPRPAFPPAKDPDLRKAFCTPLVISVGGSDQLISPGADRVVSYNPQDGRQIWLARYDGFSNVPRPVYGHGLVYVCSGFGSPELLAIRPDGTGDVTPTRVAWRIAKQVPNNPSPVIVGDEFYMVSDRGIATCLDATSGEEIWKKRLDGNFTSSLLYADGRIYLFSEEGTGFVLAPGRQFKILATNQLEGRCMASPAAVGKALYLRTDSHLYRIEH